MKVVSNASPLINLARIGRLSLLPRIFSRVLIPEAVWQEVVVDGEDQPGAKEIHHALWVERAVVSNHQLVRSLRQELDPGEAEAIALAIEINADWLMIEAFGKADSAAFWSG